MKSKDVAKFNQVTGKGPSDDLDELLEQMRNQSTILLEEVLETKAAATDKDWVEALDGVCDIWFVASELVTQLESVGINVKKAFKAVCENNSLKYTTSKELVEQWLVYNQTKGVDCHIYEGDYEGVTHYCVRRNEDNKVLKYEDFPVVDLKPFIPEQLIK